MIRKIEHITITALFLILTLGFTVSRHYCGGALVHVSFFSNEVSSCTEGGMTCEADGCCQDKHQVVQLDEDYAAPGVQEHVAYFPVIFAEFMVPAVGSHFFQEANFAFTPAEPPPPREVTNLLSDIQVYRL